KDNTAAVTKSFVIVLPFPGPVRTRIMVQTNAGQRSLAGQFGMRLPQYRGVGKAAAGLRGGGRVRPAPPASRSPTAGFRRVGRLPMPLDAEHGRDTRPALQRGQSADWVRRDDALQQRVAATPNRCSSLIIGGGVGARAAHAYRASHGSTGFD